ncbi:hypothetical protein MGYG_03060 [Nannizzia gypsea CBS 118893]|uniref:Uncharacterized protein n=1 Tax=Arthroderma gypseum (strain ATCC MYA-4604 / CBS 118893) TaxID=535722 RepID=E4UQN6_ARTGP|nr:hypothetical protein MGYG_03060 [Nannizzia gypsea CBS 118893]EFR00054.1 hypothetical protein MGYG_03060 [Nannizzia gypsea CBS 118893]
MGVPALLIAGLAATVSLASADVAVGGGSLVKYTNCNKMQQNQIYEAWFDSIKIANEGKGNFGDWKGDAEIEYFGPPGLNHPYQRSIQEILMRAASLSRPWWFRPTSTRIHARCDDWQKKCAQNGPALYVSRFCTEGEGICINFCDGFFNLPSLNDVVNAARPLKNDDIFKLHMATYQSRGSSMLHGLLHLPDVSFPERHINDRVLQFRTTEGKTAVAQAIGPYWTKVLARIDLLNSNSSSLTFPINADNLVQYSLAKYIYGNLKIHPYYPIALSKTLGPNNETQGLGWELADGKIEGNTTMIGGFISPADAPVLQLNNITIASFDEVGNDPNYLKHFGLPLETFIEYGKYPASYFTGDRAEAKPAGRPQLTVKGNYTKPDENLHCAIDEVTGEGYVTVDFAESSINDACSKFNDLPLGLNSTGTQNSYEFVDAEKQHNALWVGASWNTADPGCLTNRNVVEEECKDQLRRCLNGCQADTTTLKKGGSRVNNCIIYRLGVERNPSL